ncbi:MAG: 2Fe-2S iron-sulfur cluster binding domain-containing protein [Proteobacteria bacterium]|nr:2Fe-2S iron-sulfur cluster binding domain-containing protein [Pseudomonadota bacterium]MCH8116715.1 2Fe-2S iron-sulfur cluster binding domain-containing protein [Pseudomonadota bacterium]
MPKISYITPDGTQHDVDVETGYSVMEGAINNDIQGIVAECGGACACATCHSYIDEAWLDKLPKMDDMEDSMLDAAFERKSNSRLTCQLEVTDEFDGLVVHVADNDY